MGSRPEVAALETELNAVGRTGAQPAAATGPRGVFARAMSAGRHGGVGRYAGVFVALIVVSALVAVMEPRFLTEDNLANIVRTQSVVFVLAIGMTLVILTGGIDLSIASITTAAAMVLAVCIQHGASAEVGIAAGVGAGALMGLINGVLIGAAGIPFFVVTLGTLSIFQSVAFLMTTGNTVSLFSFSNFGGVSDFTNGTVGPFPSVLFLLLALYGMAGFVLHLTRAGRGVYAFGSNPAAARLAGINTTGVLVGVYAACGLCAGVGAVLLTGRLTAASPQGDPNLMLTVIAAVLIGGTAFSGGEGGLIGTVVGVLFLGVIQNGLSLADVSTFWQGTVSGMILIAAVGLGVLRGHRPERFWRVRRSSSTPDTAGTE
jgi:ribose transport system permease protein